MFYYLIAPRVAQVVNKHTLSSRTTGFDTMFAHVRELNQSLQDTINANNPYLSTKLLIMLTQTKKYIKKSDQLPAFSVLVSSLSDITESMMFSSQRVLISWLALM